jgi:cytohesin
VAVAEGRKTLVELLLARGANVAAKNKAGTTPLHVAAAKGFKVIAEILIAKGADVNAISNSKTLYSGMQTTAKPAFTDAYIQSGTPLHNAVAKGFRSLVELLLAHQADVNREAPEEVGPPLALAVQIGRADMVKLLLEHGADVNAKGGDGNPALLLAAGQRTTEIMRMLLAHNASVNATNKEGWTPLHQAVALGDKDAVELLLAKGADPSARNNVGQTPLDSLTGTRPGPLPGPPAVYRRSPDSVPVASPSEIAEILKKYRAKE